MEQYVLLQSCQAGYLSWLIDLLLSQNLPQVEVWGSGNAKREFLNVEDLSSAIYFLLQKKIKQDFVNIGGGEQYSIRMIAKMIKKIINYKG